MKGEHDDEQSDTWQTVGAVTAKLLLLLEDVDLKAIENENLVDDQPEHANGPPSHVHNPKM